MSLLTINYGDFHPPQAYRFNERQHASLRDCAQMCLDKVSDYFSRVCSYDALNHYLYFDLTSSRSNDSNKSFGSNSSTKHCDNVIDRNNGTVRNEEKSNAEWCDVAINALYEQSIDAERVIGRLTERLEKQYYERTFVCDLNDITFNLVQCLDVDTAIAVTKRSPSCRRFALIMLNAVRKFGPSLLNGRDAVARMIEILTASNGNIEHIATEDLACQTVKTSDMKIRRITNATVTKRGTHV